MEVNVRTGPLTALKFEATDLDVARLVASVLGFSLDGQASISGATISAHKGDVTIRANGTSLNDAAKNIIKLLSEN